MLESATAIDFTDRGLNASAALRDWIEAIGGPRVRGSQQYCGTSCAYGQGGSGGPGVVQLHVPISGLPPSNDPSSSIVVPTAALSLPDPLAGIAAPDPVVLVPSFDPDE